MTPSDGCAGAGGAEPTTRARWWGGNADRGDSIRLKAFSDGVLAIAITLLILDVRVDQQPGQSLAATFGHATLQIVTAPARAAVPPRPIPETRVFGLTRSVP